MNPSITESDRWSKATLRISSQVLEPAEIGTRLGLLASNIHKKGDLKSGRVRIPWKESLWRLESPLGDGSDMAEHVSWLLDVLEPKLDLLKQLAESCRIDLFCGFSSSHGQGGFTLDSRLIGRLAKLDLPINLSLHPPDSYWGSDSDDVHSIAESARSGIVYLVGAGPGDPGQS